MTTFQSLLQQNQSTNQSNHPFAAFLSKEWLHRRPRRNRQSPAIRSMLQETRLHPNHFIAPCFIIEGQNTTQIIPSMPGVLRYTVDLLVKEAIELYQLGIRAIDLFCMVPLEKKDPVGSEAIRPGNLLQIALRALKKEIPEMCLIVDVALDPFTSHGHDGVLNSFNEIDNDASLQILAQMSLLAAQAGADIIAPSDMMDGRVAYIRSVLDQAGFYNVGILSYTAKYASAFYGPFRDALQSAPKFGDKKTYQMNPANIREALIECALDNLEGADMIMIKPALPYLDVISKIREACHLPIAAYHVSGEYSMVMAAHQNGWLDADRVFEESLLSIKRAGADFTLTYAARRVAENLKKQNG